MEQGWIPSLIRYEMATGLLVTTRRSSTNCPCFRSIQWMSIVEVCMVCPRLKAAGFNRSGLAQLRVGLRTTQRRRVAAFLFVNLAGTAASQKVSRCSGARQDLADAHQRGAGLLDFPDRQPSGSFAGEPDGDFATE